MAGLDGVVAFARFAYPPNALGYCGPADSAELLDRVASGDGNDAGLRGLARRFEGAWPYLELIAAANGLADPLDLRVVEAYWIGNALLDRVPAGLLAASLEERFRPRLAAGSWQRLAEPVGEGAAPHHGFHVFGVYPWVGLLRSGSVDQPLHVLDRCRIRWGRVVSVDGETALVRSRLLAWDGRRLVLGVPQLETARTATAGRGLAGQVRPGDVVALHWDWVCQRLTPRQLGALRGWTGRVLQAVNGVAHPAPATVLA